MLSIDLGPLRDGVIGLLRERAEPLRPSSHHELARFRFGDTLFVIYRTGRMTVNREIPAVLRNPLIRLYLSRDEDGYVVGSDEAGKGESKGPLVVAAVGMNPEERAEAWLMGVQDSKRLSAGRVHELASRLLTYDHAVEIMEPREFNRRFKGNLTEILNEMHTRAIEKVDGSPARVIVDAFPGVNVRNAEAITGAERFIPVAAASILARYYYLEWLEEHKGLPCDDYCKLSYLR